MPDPDPEFLATYGRWNLDTFLECFELENTVMALVSVETRSRTDEGRAVTNDLVHRIWQVVVTIPGCAGHRLSWGQLLFLLPHAEQERAAQLLSGVSSLSSTHSIRHWLSNGASSSQERRAAIRALEERRERDLSNP